MKKKGNDIILPILALVMSAAALVGNYDLSNILSFVVSLIGIAAGATYFMGHRWSSTLLQIWIYAQIPAISNTVNTTLDNGATMSVVRSYLDAGQVITFDVGLTLGTRTGDLDLKVNIVPFGLLILFRLLQVSALIGSTATIKKFRKDNKLGEVFPLTGSVLKRITLGKEKQWLLIQLNESLQYAGKAYAHLLVRPKEDEIYKKDKEGKVSYLVLVEDAARLRDGVNRKEDLLFADWGMVSVE